MQNLIFVSWLIRDFSLNSQISFQELCNICKRLLWMIQNCSHPASETTDFLKIWPGCLELSFLNHISITVFSNNVPLTWMKEFPTWLFWQLICKNGCGIWKVDDGKRNAITNILYLWYELQCMNILELWCIAYGYWATFSLSRTTDLFVLACWL